MFKNLQRAEPFDKESGQTIEVVSIFHTIQGEGPFVGYPAVFIRLAGCNLKCPMCDTDYTTGRKRYSMRELISAISAAKGSHDKTKLFVITGGEPFRQDITALIKNLLLAYYGSMIQIESNGVFLPTEPIRKLITNTDSVKLVVSPKTNKINPDIWKYACAFKYVIDANSVNPDDGLPITALGHAARPYVARPPIDYSGPIYVSPMDTENELANARNRRATLASAMAHGYVFGLQVHKIVSVE